MTINKGKLGNKRKALNTIAQEIDDTVEATSTNATDISTLEGLLNGYEIVSCSIENADDGSDSTLVNLPGALPTDVAIAIAANLNNGVATFLKTAVAGGNRVTVTFDANTGTGDKFNLLVIRPVS